MAGKDWERVGGAPTGQRDNETSGQRDLGTTGRRDDETSGQRDCETTRRQDDKTARRRDDGTTGRRDDGTAGRRDNETTGRRDDGTTGQRDNENPEKHRCSQAFSGVLSSARLCEAAWRQSGADVVHRKREYHGIVLKRTDRGTLLFGMCRRCATITSSKKKSCKKTPRSPLN